MQGGIPSVASIRSARTPRDGLRRLQDVPKTPHKRAPGSPRRPQEGLLEPPWSLPEPTQSCLNFRQGSQSLLEPPWSLPGASWDPPRSLPGSPRTLPGGPGAFPEPPKWTFGYFKINDRIKAQSSLLLHSFLLKSTCQSRE